eukprot:scaffold671355_cov57-Prasinocladus_malaysianus.AAC.1
MQWGAWSGVGMAVKTANVLAKAHNAGIGIVEPFQGLTALTVVWNHARHMRSPLFLVTPLD